MGEAPPPITFLSICTQCPRDHMLSCRVSEEKNSWPPLSCSMSVLFSRKNKFVGPLFRVQLYKENHHLTLVRTEPEMRLGPQPLRTLFIPENMCPRDRERKKIPFWTNTQFSRPHRDTLLDLFEGGSSPPCAPNLDLISHVICRMMDVIHTRNPHTNTHSTSRIPRNTSGTEYKVRGAQRRRASARRRRAPTGSDQSNEDQLMGECLEGSV